MPPAENVHWLFAAGILFLGLCLLARALVGRERWDARRWRAYLVPSLLLAVGCGMWPVTVFFTSSAIHMMAHATWAELVGLAGLVQLGLVAGRLRSRLWELSLPLAVAVSGAGFVVHEQNPWLFMRSAFLHHAIGWTLIVGSLFPLSLVVRPRSRLANAGFAAVAIGLAVMLFADRDLAPIFGHLSPLAGAGSQAGIGAVAP